MDLTTEARVRVMIQASDQVLPTTATLTTYLGRLITDWSVRAKVVMTREVSFGTYTEYLDVSPGQRIYSLKAYPVSSIVSVTNDADRLFTGATVAATEYTCVTSAGILKLSDYTPSSGDGALKVVYKGGMARTAASFAVSYPDIATAIDQQVAYAFERKGSLGREQVAAGPGSVSYVGALDWLPAVRHLLLSYRRVYLG